MNDIRELATEWEVAPEPLIQAVEAAQRARRYGEAHKPLIASAEPVECKHRLRQAYKAIKALPLRAKAHLHWRLTECITYGPHGLSKEQIRQVMEDINWVNEILAALAEPLDTEPEDRQRELLLLVQAWERAGGKAQEGGRHDCYLIEFLSIAYRHLGPPLTDDAIRRRLDRLRRAPSNSEG